MGSDTNFHELTYVTYLTYITSLSSSSLYFPVGTEAGAGDCAVAERHVEPVKESEPPRSGGGTQEADNNPLPKCKPADKRLVLRVEEQQKSHQWRGGACAHAEHETGKGFVFEDEVAIVMQRGADHE